MQHRVLLITTNYWPEPTGIAVYTTDLAETLKTNQHKVTVLTSLPHYPWWKIPQEFAHLGEGVTSHNGVEIIRTQHLVPKKINILLRVRFEFSLWWNLKRVSKRLKNNEYDVVIGCMPTVAAGTFSLNCAYFGIPCIGNNKVDTQKVCHPDLSVDVSDIEGAVYLANKLKTDSDFYSKCSVAAKQNYNQYYNIETWKSRINLK
jgi:hypothetical protein